MKPHFEDLDRLKEKLDAHRPLDAAIVSNLWEDLLVRWTYHSNVAFRLHKIVYGA